MGHVLQTYELRKKKWSTLNTICKCLNWSDNLWQSFASSVQEKDYSSSCIIIYQFRLNYAAVTNSTNILEASNLGERLIFGFCLVPCRWAVAGLQVLCSLWNHGRRSTPNWNMLVSWQREKRDGRTSSCLLKLLFGNRIGHCSHFVGQTKSCGQASHGGQPSNGWESIILPQGRGVCRKGQQMFWQ